MRKEEEVRERVRELVKTELKRRLDDAHVKLPHRCVHNHRHALDTRKTILGEPNTGYNLVQDARHLPLAQTMGLCMLGAEDPEQWTGDICDEPIDAQRCPYFKPREDDLTLTTEFWKSVKDPKWVDENLPAVAALLWVCAPAVQDAPEEQETTEPPNEDKPAPPVTEPANEDKSAPLAVDPPNEDKPAPLVVAPKLTWWARLVRWLVGSG